MRSNLLNALNAAIVFSLVFFLLSTAASHITEVLAGYLNSRGKLLRQQLATALTQPVSDEIFADPVIHAFALGSRATTQAAPTQATPTQATTSQATPTQAGPSPSYITPAAFARAVTRAAATSGSHSATSDVLQELLSDAQHRAIAAETAITEWFAEFSDRVSGIYRRHTTLRLFAVGCLAAAALDIDVVHLAQYLWTAPSLTAAAADQIAATFAGIASTTTQADMQALAAHGADLTKSLGAGLGGAAFGWQQLRPLATLPDLGWWAAKILGWLLAAVATSFGAQFWFELLSDSLKIRMAGKRPATAAPASPQTDAPQADSLQAGPPAPLPAPPARAPEPQAAPAPPVILAAAVAPIAQPPLLGVLSAKYEVGNRGCGTVSSGVGDPGGVSYGSYQMTSQPDGGTVRNFVAQLPAPLRAQFAPHAPGSPAFTQVWQHAAQADATGFFLQQHDYIRITHYDPLCRTVEAKVSIPTRSIALQNVVWSTAVQHGPRTPILAMETAKFDFGGDADAAHHTDSLLIEAIYAERGRTLPNGCLAWFTNSAASVQAAGARRFVSELHDALTMLADEVIQAVPARADEYVV